MTIKQLKSIETVATIEGMNTYALIWYDNNFNIFAIEPYSISTDDHKRFYNRISGIELQDVLHSVTLEHGFECENETDLQAINDRLHNTIYA